MGVGEAAEYETRLGEMGSLAGVRAAVQRGTWGVRGARGNGESRRVVHAGSTSFGIDGEAAAHDESTIGEPGCVRAMDSMTSICPS